MQYVCKFELWQKRQLWRLKSRMVEKVFEPSNTFSLTSPLALFSPVAKAAAYLKKLTTYMLAVSMTNDKTRSLKIAQSRRRIGKLEE
jgi:hypothetical protein